MFPVAFLINKLFLHTLKRLVSNTVLRNIL